MKILSITSQNRRDFRAIYICETCGYKKEGYGYDDDNFHKNVIPTMKCEVCGSFAPDNYEPRSTKYSAYEVI